MKYEWNVRCLHCGKQLVMGTELACQTWVAGHNCEGSN